jgi:di/tricarboxylate transporter
MTASALWVFTLLAACMAAFILNRPRMDVVALLALVALVLSGVLTVPEAVAGFSEPSVLLIAAFFVIGEGLVRTGIAFRVGDWLLTHAGASEARLIVLLMLAVTGLGAFMSSTGVVAIFIPVALSVASRLNIPPGRLMMPLCFAALISGMQTLVATPPNLVMNAELIRNGHEGFGFFAFTPMGLIVLVMGILYMLVARRWLSRPPAASCGPSLERRRLRDLIRDYQLAGHARRLYVPASSPLVGRTLGELRLRSEHGINVVAVERERHLRPVMLDGGPDRKLLANDIILIDFKCPEEALNNFCGTMHLIPKGSNGSYLTDHSRELGLAEVLIPPASKLIDKTIHELGFRTQYRLHVVGLRRNGQALEDILETKLKMGDTLLVAGKWKAIQKLQAQAHDFVVLSLPAEIEEAIPAARRAPHALFTLVLTIGLMISGVVPNLIAALIGCLLMVGLRCLDLDSAYRSIHWQSIILIVGMMPFATALQKTGGIDVIVSNLLAIAGNGSPHAVLTTLFVMTALVGLFISNTATAVLMAPIAIATAAQLGTSPLPFAMTVAVAASAAFMTPVSSPVNTLVLGPGQYRFMDYVRIGVPFTLLVMLASVVILPWLFPFDAQ